MTITAKKVDPQNISRGNIYPNTPDNKKILNEQYYTHFNKEVKEGKYLQVVSGDCYLIVNESIFEPNQK